MNKKQLIIMGLVLALSLPLNVWAATTLGENLVVGDGTPDVTLDGEDAYIEGTLEVDGGIQVDGPTSFNGGSLGVTATDDMASFAMINDSAVPEADDTIGAIYFVGNDSLGDTELYGSMSVVASSVTNDSEQGVFVFRLQNGDGSGSNVGGFFSAGSDDENIFFIGDITGESTGKTGVVTSEDDADIKIDPDGAGIVELGGSGTRFTGDILASDEYDGGYTKAVKQTLIIERSALLPLLDGTEQTLATFNQGTIITDVALVTNNPSAAAATIDIGVDDGFASGDINDAYISDLASNTGAPQRAIIDNTIGAYGNAVEDVTGNLTIQSSADLTLSAYEGFVFIEYYDSNLF
jgi:hypothetical protein